MKCRTTARCIGASTLVWCVCNFLAASTFALPTGRHYEMVSSPYKGGYSVIDLVGAAVAGAGEGDRAAFRSLGTFAGAPANTVVNIYLAKRSASGWLTEPLALPSTPELRGSFSGISPSLESALFVGLPFTDAGQIAPRSVEPNEVEFLVHRLEAPGMPFDVLGGTLARLDKGRLDVRTVGESLDLCHVAVLVGFGSSEARAEALLPEAVGTLSVLYDLSGGGVHGCGSDAPSLRLVAVANEDGPNGGPKPLDPYCLSFFGASEAGNRNRFNAVSADGAEIFFTTNANLAVPECDGESVEPKPEDPAILFVRLAGQHTLQVSQPIAPNCEESAPCHSAKQQRAEFTGASEDGSRVFFTTRQPLVTGDTDTGQDLYMATIGCPASNQACSVTEREVTSLTQISHSPIPGEAADVQSEEAAALSPNGKRVYFVARGALTEGLNHEGQLPVKGADNFYVYDAESGSTRFIADLCSGHERSGEVSDIACTGGADKVWTGAHEIQTTSDGRFAVFVSYAQLTADDSDAFKDVYRYDAQTEELVRLSVGEGGFDANGNGEDNAEIAPEATQGTLAEDYGISYKAISSDGSRVVFSTAEPLSPKAVNGLENAYEWHEAAGSKNEGEVSLVSTGSDEESVGGKVFPPVITPSGRDLFFLTVQGLSGQDTDGVADVYDARLGTGFPPESARLEPCSGDACQGPLTQPAATLVPGSASQAPGENMKPAAVVKKARRVASCRRGFSLNRRHKCVKKRKRGRGRS